ncbi:glucosaminidase domain-containing protein, partial [uncultured Duncaniella sp.]
GIQEADAELMYRYVASRNPDFPREIAQAFYDIGELYGIRGDIAICQAIIETGWFRFDNGTAVRPSAHNYCGLGVRKRGEHGCSFRSVREGVTAMIQHLYAYSCREPLPLGEDLLDPRFCYVSRGSASSWEALSGRWAMNSHYGMQIIDIFNKMLSHPYDPLTAETLKKNSEQPMPDEETMLDKSFFE